MRKELGEENPELYQQENIVHLSEPWVRLHNQKDLVGWGKKEEINWNQIHRQRAKYEFYIKAFDFLTDNLIVGDYLEFGCHRARTFRMALTEARHHNLKDMKFHAFDSFEGLPESNKNHGLKSKWDRGQLVTTESEFRKIMKIHGLYLDQIKTYPGFYQKSLDKELEKEFIEKGIKASLVCIDCDLYESAVPVFGWIEPFLQEGTVIYIDDYWVGYKGNPKKGVSKAFMEHKKKSKYKYEEYVTIGWQGKSFIVYS